MIDRRTFLWAVSGVAIAKAARAVAPSLRIALVGDCLFTDDLVRTDPALQPILPILRNADLTVGNFEGTLADAGAWAIEIEPNGKPICGGLNVRAHDQVAKDLAWLGFEMVGTANNHAWDWGPEGLLATIKKLRGAGLHPAGTGEDLATARLPSYCEVKGASVALISCASTFWPGTNASRSNSVVPGRPGVNPVRFTTTGSGTDTKTTVDPQDLLELTNAIRVAKAKSDLVIVSCHTHEEGSDRFSPPDFQREFAHACVDAGAGLFFSHGPHLLRGIEVFKQAPILYGLGSFIFRNYPTMGLPEELFESCGLESRDSAAYIDTISKGWSGDLPFMEAVIAEVEFRASRFSGIKLTPTVIQTDRREIWGMPSLADKDRGATILARMQRLSQPFGVSIEIDHGVGRLRV
jgi:poly-gamma-glutamate capsule biosynthesis protein CapA/YwtB (metallophosphatase superfamily)